MDLLNSARAAACVVSRTLRGESVELRGDADAVQASIPDAVVSIDEASAGEAGSGPAAFGGTLRLAEEWRSAALASVSAVVRGRVWVIAGIGDVNAGRFRVFLRTPEEVVPNLVDIDGTPAIWAG